jgi:hypothetical protein
MINALSREYNRDLYCLNLKEFENDKQLQNAFAQVPKGSIVVFEDVDAQSRCVWDRQRRKKLEMEESLMLGPVGAPVTSLLDGNGSLCKKKDADEGEEEGAVERGRRRRSLSSSSSLSSTAVSLVDRNSGLLTPVSERTNESNDITEPNNIETNSQSKPLITSSITTSSSSSSSSSSTPPPPPPPTNGPSLATLLNCLDGHSMNENLLIIMTSNHPEVLDPAVIRPGRIDLHLRLGYCTAYQCAGMYLNVLERPGGGVNTTVPSSSKSSDQRSKTDFTEMNPLMDDSLEDYPNLDETVGNVKDDDGHCSERFGIAQRLLDAGFIEHVLAPCEAMRIMLVYRLQPRKIKESLVRRSRELAGLGGC